MEDSLAAALVTQRGVSGAVDRGRRRGLLLLETRFELIEFLSEQSVGDRQLAYAEEGTHDLDVEGDRTFAAEDRESMATPGSVKA